MNKKSKIFTILLHLFPTEKSNLSQKKAATGPALGVCKP